MKISTVERVVIEHNGDHLEMPRAAANRLFQILAIDKREKRNGNRKRR